jgi:hypothetical protein
VTGCSVDDIIIFTDQRTDVPKNMKVSFIFSDQPILLAGPLLQRSPTLSALSMQKTTYRGVNYPSAELDEIVVHAAGGRVHPDREILGAGQDEGM